LKGKGRDTGGQAGNFFRWHFCERARAGTTGQDIKATLAGAAINGCYGIIKFNPAGHNRGQIGFWCNPKLYINIGKAEVAIDQKRSLAQHGKSAGERYGGECLSDATFTRGNGDDGGRLNP
jgi:hypothetical protein